MIKNKFYIRKDYLVDGQAPVYLSLTQMNHKRERIPLLLYVDPKYWSKKENKIITTTQELIDKQLILDNVMKKLTEIRTFYRLQDLELTPKIMRDEYENKVSRVNFIAFFKEALAKEKHNMADGSYARHESVYKKLYEYQPYVPFNTLTLEWLEKYKAYLKITKENENTTIAANMASIKKFLIIASKSGIKLMFQYQDIKVGSTKGNRTYLTAQEVSACMDFYFSKYIKPRWKLILGYFLFSCMNGLRISNVQKLKRAELMDTHIHLIMVKGNKDKSLLMNKTIKFILDEYEPLFVKKVSDNEINSELKLIMKFLGIKKHVSFHVARHTFATLFLKAGGKVEKLQLLLGHSSIEETMIYSHILEEDANEEMLLIDQLLAYKKIV